MDRIDAMQAFVTVADLQGFAPAARKLGLSPSGVTRLDTAVCRTLPLGEAMISIIDPAGWPSAVTTVPSTRDVVTVSSLKSALFRSSPGPTVIGTASLARVVPGK